MKKYLVIHVQDAGMMSFSKSIGDKNEK